MFKIEDCLTFLTCKSSKELSGELENRILPWGITRVQWMALHYIQRGEGITQKELSRCMALRESTTAKLLERMEVEGLVVRTSKDGDKRAKIVEMTEKGMRLNKEITPVVEAFIAQATHNLTEEDLDTFKMVLRVMVENTVDKNFLEK